MHPAKWGLQLGGRRFAGWPRTPAAAGQGVQGGVAAKAAASSRLRAIPRSGFRLVHRDRFGDAVKLGEVVQALEVGVG
jgi:hypothetical protein